VHAVTTPARPAGWAGQRPAPGGESIGTSHGSSGLPAQRGRLAFLDEEGQVIHPMPADYGFRSGAARLYQQAGNAQRLHWCWFLCCAARL
jgi:hypothetical protein